MLEMAMQVVLAVLLLVSIGWSAVLHRRLAMLRQGGDGIARFVDDLIGATGRAEAAIRDMRVLATDLARQWQRQRGEGDGAVIELRRLLADAETVARELGLAVAAGGTMAEPCRPAIPTANARTTSTGERPEADFSAHERIRQAIRDLR